MSADQIQILLAEDSEEDILLMEAALSDQKRLALVGTAENGAEALDQLRAAQQGRGTLPDLILMDINMPRVNGFEALEAIRSDPGLRRIPVLMLTTSLRARDMERAYELGAASFICKPVEFGQLRTALQQIGDYWGTLSRLPRNAEATAGRV